MTTNGPKEEDVRRAVRERYSNLANKSSECCCKTDYAFSKGAGAGDAFPRGLMYSREELDVLPPEVFEVSAGCGNPLALAGLKPGDVVVDLGSGGGIILGYCVTKNVNQIERWISIVFGLKLWKSSTYMFSRIPNQVDWNSVVVIVAAAVVAVSLGALLPAVLAARTKPVNILRYE